MYLFFKDVIDRILALMLFLLLIIIPIIPITMLAIWIEDPGNIFFKQKRIGKNNKEFEVFKFRSMYHDAEEKMKQQMMEGKVEHLNFKDDGNAMITKVGKIIRKLSIDELPQLINIIKGDMSIVGPRPLQRFEVIHYIVSNEASGNSELMIKRNSVKPGLLCYWQIIPNKNEIPFQTRMKLDIKYIDEMSFKTDVILILKGAQVVLLGNNS